ncbi:PerC family transcriptional regulator [Pantoea cypripedii]|uniref:PerC family transcriptional regulator n=1 Tax=Pantoea cypripedii TaxID=55209 RepID=A0A1X1EY39_PANCY|nr:PerC family transcriptional regulator [Pantoea cypripedii]ORM94918.1 PerC family transcriptional regulator [Pantoea cypripedii]
MELKDGIAELLESRGQWRRAARRWLTVMDHSANETEREAIARRREHCIDMGANIPPDGRRTETRRLYKTQSRYNEGY